MNLKAGLLINYLPRSSSWQTLLRICCPQSLLPLVLSQLQYRDSWVMCVHATFAVLGVPGLQIEAVFFAEFIISQKYHTRHGGTPLILALRRITLSLKPA